MSEFINWRAILRGADDETVRQPLWAFPPDAANAVIAERTRRGFNLDPEPIGDPDYS